jgi:transcriptional regulator with XRE-family HTH domain
MLEWSRDEDLPALGGAVRELRARQGFSQEELGHESGLHRNYVGSIERGEQNITFRVLLRLIVGPRVPLSELVEMFERNRAARHCGLPVGYGQASGGRS